MKIEDAFPILCTHYGSHSAAAEALHYTARHYRNLRQKSPNIPARAADLITGKAAVIQLNATVPEPKAKN